MTVMLLLQIAMIHSHNEASERIIRQGEYAPHDKVQIHSFPKDHGVIERDEE